MSDRDDFALQRLALAIGTSPAPSHQPETTSLSSEDEAKFQDWARVNRLTDVDSPEAHYDYRGFWQQNPQFRRAPGQHLTDQFKQHGHESFSTESQYSRGLQDGGQWVGDGQNSKLIPPPVASHLTVTDPLTGQQAQVPKSTWEQANTPVVNLPRMDETGQVDWDQLDPMASEAQSEMRAGKTAWNQGLAPFIEGNLTPAAITTMLATAGGSVAARFGLFGVSQLARLTEAALSIPFIAHGIARAGEAKTPGDFLGGVLETALGGWNMHGAGTRAFDPKLVARTYLKEHGIPERPIPTISKTNEAFHQQVADAYEAMPHAPMDPEVAAAYAQLSREVEDQFQMIVKRAGLKVEPWTKPGQPYANSAEMVRDVREKNHLWYFPSESGFGDATQTANAADHVQLVSSPSQQNPLLARGRFGLPINDELRVVHDYFAHAQHGFSFGPVGEENARRAHGVTLSPQADAAIASETRGQNSWVNFGAHLRDETGHVPQRGEPGYVPLPARPYAEQKTGLLPSHLRGIEPYTDGEILQSDPFGVQSAWRLAQSHPRVTGAVGGAAVGANMGADAEDGAHPVRNGVIGAAVGAVAGGMTGHGIERGKQLRRQYLARTFSESPSMAHLLDRLADPDQGFTVNPVTGKEVTGPGNYAVSIFPDRETPLSADAVTPLAVRRFFTRNSDLFKDPRNHVGGWHDPDTGRRVFDVVIVVHDPTTAANLVRKYAQKSYRDFGANKNVLVDGGKWYKGNNTSP